MAQLDILLLKLPKNTEVTPEAAQTFLSTLGQINFVAPLKKLFGDKVPPLALEMVLSNQLINFQIACDAALTPFIETQIQSNYPLVVIEKGVDVLVSKNLAVAELGLSKGSYYPINTYQAFRDNDPLASVLSVLSKGDPEETSVVQFAIESVGSSWQAAGANYAEKGEKLEDGNYRARSDQNVIKEKINYPGLGVVIRLASTANKTLSELKSSFGVFARADGNSIKEKKSIFKNNEKKLESLIARKSSAGDIYNIVELATLWHLPSDKIKALSIAWGTSVLSEPPQNLPVAMNLADESERQKINFFASTLYKNKQTNFGIREEDRRRHVWTIGRTGTGKSTLIANMAIDDIKKGKGVAVIDPHGDLCEKILDYIPKSRINDTIYFNPADRDFPITINPLEVRNDEEAELVVSGIVSIFNKIFGYSWGPRLEYILRNSLLTLTEVEGSTLADVLLLLSNSAYRNKVVSKLKDETLVAFWRDEFEKMPENLRKESVSPIQNKVGQFVTSPLIRRIIGSSKSSIRIDDIMNEGKILLVNLSQGRLGEDNSSLLGAMIITKLQLAAMRRVDITEDIRKDFYLYVDEFQNFATSSFIKILSEARKYRLNLMVANQYMAQIPEEVEKAILGNTGTIMSFGVGAADAAVLFKEFRETFSEKDLISLSNFQIAMKMTIKGETTTPFLAKTLPLPSSVNQNRETVIKVSRERWTKK